jgi:L-aspartate oxidase
MRVLIIGSGVAGLTAALDLAPRHEVVVITKADASESNTR